MGENFDNSFFSALDFWVPERNEVGHYQINLKQEEIERRCVEYEEKLAYILQRIAFLCKYKLVSVREIKVNHPKNQPAKFDHIVDILNSSDSDFIAKEMEEEKYSESHSILLMKSLKTIPTVRLLIIKKNSISRKTSLCIPNFVTITLCISEQRSQKNATSEAFIITAPCSASLRICWLRFQDHETLKQLKDNRCRI
jgi:hypothetical protein